MNFKLLQCLQIHGEALTHDFLLYHPLSPTLKVAKKKSLSPLSESQTYQTLWDSQFHIWSQSKSTKSHSTNPYLHTLLNQDRPKQIKTLIPSLQIEHTCGSLYQTDSLFKKPEWGKAYRSLMSQLGGSNPHSWGWIYDNHTLCLIRHCPQELNPTWIQINVDLLFQTQNKEAFTIWWNLLQGSTLEGALDQGIEGNQEWLVFRLRITS